MSVLALPNQLRTRLQYKYSHLMEWVHSLRMMSRFLWLHSLILIPLFIAAATANISSTITDRDALLALKAHITHDPTNFLAKNWNTSTPVCNWTGVACDVHSPAATDNTSAITTDQDALLALKAHITHDPTNFLAKNWNTSTPVRNWPDRCRLWCP